MVVAWCLFARAYLYQVGAACQSARAYEYPVAATCQSASAYLRQVDAVYQSARADQYQAGTSYSVTENHTEKGKKYIKMRDPRKFRVDILQVAYH